VLGNFGVMSESVWVRWWVGQVSYSRTGTVVLILLTATANPTSDANTASPLLLMLSANYGVATGATRSNRPAPTGRSVS